LEIDIGRGKKGGAPTDSMTSRSFRRAAPAIPTT
jgi:hypothetical protein